MNGDVLQLKGLRKTWTGKGKGTFFALMACAMVVGGIPVLLSIISPTLNNPVLIAVCASGQFFVSIFAGIAWSKAEAVKEANTRWVPMAASACDRLATILGSVSSLRGSVSEACSTASDDLPELALEKNRPIRIHFQGLCSSNATRLSDIENHLDSALTDWERFIKQNCEGPECADIGRRLAMLRERVSTMTIARKGQVCGKKQDEPPPSTVHQTEESIYLMVTGVTSQPDRNGRWRLQQVEKGVWECEIYVVREESYGWYVEDKTNSDNYFFREAVATQFGVYERCTVCPFEGNAVVFRGAIPSAAPPPAGNLNSDTSSPATEKDVSSKLVDLALALDQYFQHAILQHCVTKDKLVLAITEATSMKEYSTMLGINCPNVVSICALSGINTVRDCFGLPAFVFDQQLHVTLCAKSSGSAKDGQGQNKKQPTDSGSDTPKPPDESKSAST